MYPANELAERTRKQLNRETIADSVKAKMPASSGMRRFSEGKFHGRPSSRHDERPTTSRSLDSPLPPSEKTQRPQQIAQRAQQRPSSHQRPSHDGDSLLRRHCSEELVSSHGASFVPRPPSRQKTEGRPKSAKGRMRPSSHVGRENIASREGLSDIGEQVSFPPPLKPQLSFSKYKPLPSIGTGLVPEEVYHSASGSLLKRTINDSDNANDVNSLSQKTAGLSLQYSLPDEPTDTETGRIHLAIKLLDGSRHERWFRHTDTLGAVMAFASSVCNDQLPPCQICTNELPRRVFDDFSVSLSQAKINSKTVLYLEDVVS